MLDGKVYARLSLCNAVYAHWGDVCIFHYFWRWWNQGKMDYNVYLNLLFLCLTRLLYVFTCTSFLLTSLEIINDIDLVIIYTGCPGGNVPDFGRVFLKLKYIDLTKNTYIWSSTVTEIMAREIWKYESCYTLTDYQIHIKTGRNMWFLWH